MSTHVKFKQYLEDGFNLPHNFGYEDSNPKESKIWVLNSLFLERIRTECIRGESSHLMFFTGKKYEAILPDPAEQIVRDILEDKGCGAAYMMKSPIRIVKECIKSATFRNPFEPQRGLIAFRNGVLDLEKLDNVGQVGEEDKPFTDRITPQHQTRIYFDQEYNPAIKAPMFDKFIRRVLPNEATRRALQEFVGAAFLNRKKYQVHKMCFMLGGGLNGKSVFLKCIEYVLGEEHCSNYSTDDLFTSDKKANSIAGCNGKILNICHDMTNTNIFGGDFNKFVAGEPMIGRFLHHDQFTVRDIPLFIAGLNEMPPTGDWSNGYLRRLLIIPFNETISEQEADPELFDKLKAEKMGILNWIIEGRMRFVAQGCKFTESNDLSQAKRMNTITRLSPLKFMYANGFFPKNYGSYMIKRRISNAELYAMYKAYMKDTNPRGGVFESLRFADLLTRVGGYSAYRITTERGKEVYTLSPGYSYDADYDEIMTPEGKIVVKGGELVQMTLEEQKELRKIELTKEEREAEKLLPF